MCVRAEFQYFMSGTRHGKPRLEIGEAAEGFERTRETSGKHHRAELSSERCEMEISPTPSHLSAKSGKLPRVLLILQTRNEGQRERNKLSGRSRRRKHKKVVQN